MNIFAYKWPASKLVSKAHNLQLPIITDNDIANVQILDLDVRISYFFEEHFLILNVILLIS
jgi:hypothetical protein